MRGVRFRQLAVMALCVGLGTLAEPSSAQVRPTAGQTEDFGGLPRHVSRETGVPFFSDVAAYSVDKLVKDMRGAIVACDRAAYDRARGELVKTARNWWLASGGAGETSAQAGIDGRSMQEAVARAPDFPNCTPFYSPSSPRLELYIVGGGVFPLPVAGNVTGVDTFFGPGNFRIANQSGGVSNATVSAGARGRYTGLHREVMGFERSFLDTFVETGIQTGFGAQSFIQTFQNLSGVPQAFGSSTINENFQIPIVAGLTVPIGGSSTSAPPLMIDIYGGITLDSWTQTLQGRESGAPGGPGFFGQNRRFTVDPTVGVGVRVPVGDPGLGLPLILGLNAEFQFRPGSVVTAPSQNFLSETYYGTVDPFTNAAIMARIGFPLGGR